MISSNIFFTSKFPEMFPTEMRVSSHICIVFQKHESVQYIAALAITDHHIKKCTRSYDLNIFTKEDRQEDFSCTIKFFQLFNQPTM